jgi:uncharacterized protein YcbK (DUF882 family)
VPIETLPRRRLLQLGLATAGLAVLPKFARAEIAPPQAEIRRLAVYNLHTGESFREVYWEKGEYVADALAEADKVLRDFRTGEVKPIDRRLFDLLDDVSAKVETNKPFQIISAYRSPKTNAMLKAEHENSGVATKSLHMDGMAMDVRLEDVQLANLRRAALSLGRGGVGYYPRDNFVHMDVGRVRQWGG